MHKREESLWSHIPSQLIYLVFINNQKKTFVFLIFCTVKVSKICSYNACLIYKPWIIQNIYIGRKGQMRLIIKKHFNWATTEQNGLANFYLQKEF